MTDGIAPPTGMVGARFRETALRAMLREPDDLAYPLVTDLAHRPLTVEIIAPHALTTIQKVACGLFVAFPALFLLLGAVDGNITLIGIALFLLALAALAFWLMLTRARMQWRVTWGDRSVEVHDRRWGRDLQWSAPYSEYSGVRTRKSRLPTYGRGSYETGKSISVVELVHEEPEKTLLLTSIDPSPEVERLARANAAHLKVPFLDESV